MKAKLSKEITPVVSVTATGVWLKCVVDEPKSWEGRYVWVKLDKEDCDFFFHLWGQQKKIDKWRPE